MQDYTTVTIDGAKTPLSFGCWYDFGLRDGTTIRRVRLDGRAPNGDLEIVGTEDGPSARLRPSKIALVSGAGNIETALDAVDQDDGPDPRGSGPDRYPDVDSMIASEGAAPTLEISLSPDLSAAMEIATADDADEPYVRKLSRALDQVRGTSFADQDDDVEPAPSRESLIRDLESGSAAPSDFGLPEVVVVDPVFETGLPTWTSGPIETLRSGRIRLPSETAAEYVARIERELSGLEYAKWIRSDRGQAALANAAAESKAARSGRYASGREAVAKVLSGAPETAGSTSRTDGEPSASSKRATRTRSSGESVPDGSKRCSGVPKREIAPHVASVADFGPKRTAKDGLSSTCRTCHKVFAEIGRAKRQEAKVASDV